MSAPTPKPKKKVLKTLLVPPTVPLSQIQTPPEEEEPRTTSVESPPKEEEPRTTLVESPPQKQPAIDFELVAQNTPFGISKPTKKRYLNMLVYGDSGVGKTTFVASAQEVKNMKDVLVLSVEAGELSLAEQTDVVDTISITSYAQFARVYEWMHRYCKARDSRNIEKMCELEAVVKVGQEGYGDTYAETFKIVRNNPRCYRTVAIDSLTEVQKLCMYQLLGIKVGDFALDMEPQQAQFAEWGKAAEMIRLLVRTFRNLPMHALFVTLELEDKDNNMIVWRPALPGKLSFEILGYLDVVGYMRTKLAEGDINRRMFLRPSERYKAKDRYHVGNTIPHIDDPTIKKFLEA